MASTATSGLNLEKPAAGDYDGAWAPIANTNYDLIDEAIAGVLALSCTGGTDVLTNTDYATNEARHAVLNCTGTLASNHVIEIPNQEKIYAVRNATSGAYTLTIQTNTATTAVVVPQGFAMHVFCDGSDNVRPLTVPVAYDATDKNYTLGLTNDTTTPAPYLLAARREYTSSDTYAPAAWVRAIYAEVQGGGGGGGGADGQGSGTAAVGRGGGGGGYSAKFIEAPASSWTVTIGAAGSGGSAGANNGSAGGNSVFTDGGSVTLTANGGAAGGGATGTSGGTLSDGASGGTATGGQKNRSGGNSSHNRVFGGDVYVMSHGGDSWFGIGGQPSLTSAGGNASGYGAGGAGATAQDTATNYAGGDGTAGLVIIWEYA